MKNIKETLYNENVKREFLKRRNGRIKRTSELLFKLTAPYEETYDKDFYEMELSEIVFVVQETIGVLYVEKVSLNPYLQIIKLYLDWAFDCNYINQSVSKTVIDYLKQPHCIYSEKAYRYKFVKDEIEFLEFLDYLFPKDWVNASTSNLRLYVTELLLFNGIPINDIGYILKSNVDFDNKTISFIHQSDGESYTIKMLDFFIPMYKKIFDVSKNKILIKTNSSQQSDKTRNIDTKYFMALSGDASNFSTNISTKITLDQDRLNDLLKKNKIRQKPIILKHNLVFWNGLMYRMYLSMVNKQDYCVKSLDGLDERSSTVGEIFQDYYDVFYNNGFAISADC